MNTNYSDAFRLLQRCTFGPSADDVDDLLSESGIEAWIDHQVSLPATSWLSIYEDIENRFDGLGHGLYYASSWTQMTVNTDDILRHRIAYILSELFVVSVSDPAFKPAARRRYMCNYFDGLAEHAFGNFRDLLRFVSTSPVMGEYLTFVGNRSTGEIAPDENYARELLQLFTLGTVKLDGGGQVDTDDNNEPIPVYTQDDIEDLARVFTGWEFASASGAEKYRYPMKPDNALHDSGEKWILNKKFSGLGASDELDAVIEHLMSQGNLYTYIAKFFIGKMVTSNPKPGYVRRVRNAFRNADGDMVTLLKAILTDRTVLNNDQESGKLRDPMCVFTHAMRALNVQRRNEADMWPKQFNWYERLLPMSAPSVFYYYQPDDAPSAPLFQHYVAPEFNLYQWHHIYNYGHQFKELITRLDNENKEWFMDPVGFQLFLKRNEADSAWDNQGLLDYLDEHLFGFSMSQSARSAFTDYLEACDARKPEWYREFKNLIMHALLSPEFLVQR
ncbi:DUF1800 family protein [Vibrio mediterranei]|uniref:DUF1800 family protein n=1 Tax=Vibrio mediterranei TaxID=689 RepID=UPI0040697FFA